MTALKVLAASLVQMAKPPAQTQPDPRAGLQCFLRAPQVPGVAVLAGWPCTRTPQPVLGTVHILPVHRLEHPGEQSWGTFILPLPQLDA